MTEPGSQPPSLARTTPAAHPSPRRRAVPSSSSPRHARNRRLADALQQWAFCSLTQSPGARRYYDQLRRRDNTHQQALRQLANRWVGIIHACLDRQTNYNEHLAWNHHNELAA